MIEVLRRSPVLHVGGGKTVTLAERPSAGQALSLSAEAIVDASIRRPVSPSRSCSAPRTARSARSWSTRRSGSALKSYTHLYVVGFAIQPHARTLIEQAEPVAGIPATYVQATPDLMMGDLLKNMRSSQIFSVCGLPEIKVHKATPAAQGRPAALPGGARRPRHVRPDRR